MKSMPLRPRPGYPPYDGAFPQPAQDLAATDIDLDEVDQNTGRKLLLVGGAVSAVGGLLQMQVKVKDKDEKRGRMLSKVAVLAGIGAVTWAMFDTSNREYLQNHLVSAVRQVAPPPSMQGLGADLEELAATEQKLEAMKKERIRQRMILAGVGLGPMAEPVHIQKVVQDLDPKMGAMLTGEQNRKLAAQSVQALETRKAAFGVKAPEIDLSQAKKVSMIPAVVAGAALVGGLLLMNN